MILLSFGKRWNTGEEGTILGDNSARQFFVNRFNSNELFQISHDSETENLVFGKICVEKLSVIPSCQI